MKLNFFVLFVLLNCITHTTYGDGIAVIVNADNTTENLSSQHISNIYLKRISRFPHGGNAIPIDLPNDSKVHEYFYSKIVKKTPAQLSAYWARMVFTGKGRPPRQASDGADMKNRISQDHQAIGYVREEALDDTVKVLLLIP